MDLHVFRHICFFPWKLITHLQILLAISSLSIHFSLFFSQYLCIEPVVIQQSGSVSSFRCTGYDWGAGDTQGMHRMLAAWILGFASECYIHQVFCSSSSNSRSEVFLSHVYSLLPTHTRLSESHLAAISLLPSSTTLSTSGHLILLKVNQNTCPLVQTLYGFLLSENLIQHFSMD